MCPDDQYSVRIHLYIQMISVERVLQYTRLPIEADLESRPGQKPPDTWPSRGSLEAKGLSLRYSPSLPTVLKDLHFHIREGEKVRGGGGAETIAILQLSVRSHSTVGPWIYFSPNRVIT